MERKIDFISLRAGFRIENVPVFLLRQRPEQYVKLLHSVMSEAFPTRVLITRHTDEPKNPFPKKQHHTSPILSSSSLLPDPSQLLKVLPTFFSIYFPYNYCPIYTGLAMRLAKSFPFVLRTRCDFFLCRSFIQVKY